MSSDDIFDHFNDDEDSGDLVGSPVFTSEELNWIQYSLLTSMNNRRKFGYDIPESMKTAEEKINDVLDELDTHSFGQYMDACRGDDGELGFPGECPNDCPKDCPDCD